MSNGGDHGVSACSTGGPFDGRFDSPYEYPLTDACMCPPFWLGTIPPPCPVHNPGASSSSVHYTLTTGPAPVLTDADVERIARRVVELLKAVP